MAAKLPIWDQRMLLLMKHCIDKDLVESRTDFLKSVGFNPANLSKIKPGTGKGFTLDQVITACKIYKINMNWIAGLSSEMMLQKSKTAIDQLKDAVRAVESVLK